MGTKMFCALRAGAMINFVVVVVVVIVFVVVVLVVVNVVVVVVVDVVLVVFIFTLMSGCLVPLFSVVVLSEC